MQRLLWYGYEVVCQDGMIVSLCYQWQEYMHRDHDRGRNKTEIEMFPVIWPTQHNGYQVGWWYMDQHGLLREMVYDIVSYEQDRLVYSMTYKADTLITNSKYPSRSTLEYCQWPFDFVLTKTFVLHADGLSMIWEIETEGRYMFGYHPAFVLWWGWWEMVNGISVRDIADCGHDAFLFEHTERLVLVYGDNKKTLTMETSWFGQIMWWSPDAHLVCLEPVTWYPWWDEKVWQKESGEFEVRLCVK